MSHADLLDQLADIPAASLLADARAKRHDATRHTQGSYQALFDASDYGQLPLEVRLELARLTAQWHGDERLQAHYAQRLGLAATSPASPWLSAGVAYAQVLANTPLLVNAPLLQQLRDAQWSVEAIVQLSQVVAFVSYQSRLLTGYRLILGQGQAQHLPAPAGDWHRHEHTQNGHPAPTRFTQQPLLWECWLPAPPIDQLSADAHHDLSQWQLLDHPYFRLLALDLPILRERRFADIGIFFSQGGLPRAERELAATVTSKVNGCIYCASVHALRASQLSKRTEDVQRVLDVPPGAVLSQGQDVSWTAQIDFAASLAATPERVGLDQLQILREQGLGDLQLLDLVQSVAFFSWANRLMLSLGEPYFEQ